MRGGSRLVLNRVAVEGLLGLPPKVQHQVVRKLRDVEAAPENMGYALRSPLQRFRGIHLINSLKGVTARRIRQEFPETRKHSWGTKFWSPSYCLITTGQVSIDVLKQYIDSQGGK